MLLLEHRAPAAVAVQSALMTAGQHRSQPQSQAQAQVQSLSQSVTVTVTFRTKLQSQPEATLRG